MSAWLAVVFFTWLIARNSQVYFSQPRAHGFVSEKGALADDPLWMAALVIHVAAGILCLGSAFLQFFRTVLRRLPWLHRWLGRVYVASVLFLLTPTGLYLALYAHGGAAGTVGFLLLGALTATTTWRGWAAMRRGDVRGHAAWMLRSFAMATSAITFRIAHVGLQLTGIDPEVGFLTALYLSIAGNALAAEWLLQKIRKPEMTKRTRTRYHDENHHPVPIRPRPS